MSYVDRLPELLRNDVEILKKKREEYGDSWKKQGGCSAFFNLSRKWDRIYSQSEKHGWDLFKTFHADPSPQGIIDDIGDLRRYLALVEAELMEQTKTDEGPRQSATMDDEVRRVPRRNPFLERCVLRNINPNTPDADLSDDLFQLKYAYRDILRNIKPDTNEFKDVRQKVMLELEKSR